MDPNKGLSENNTFRLGASNFGVETSEIFKLV